jgi:hypothetical protein
MRGIAEFNFPAFKEVATVLRKHGLHIASPAEKDELDGFNWTGTAGTQDDLTLQNFEIHIALLGDIEVIASKACDGIICLPGWARSSGAKAETAFAWAIGKPVRQYIWPARSNGFRHELVNVIPLGVKFDLDDIATIESWEA